MTKLFTLSLSFLLLYSAAIGQNNIAEDQKFLGLIEQTVELLQNKKYDEAFKTAETAAKLRPTDARPYAFSGLVRMEQWKLNEAAAFFTTALKYNNENSFIYFAKARVDRFRGARAEALEGVRRSIELKPDYGEAFLLLGELLTEPADRKEAFTKALFLDPNLPTSYSFFGSNVEGKFKDIKAAEEIYRTAVEMEPDTERGRSNLGRLLVKQNRLKEARDLWNELPLLNEKTFPNFITVLERAEKLQVAKDALAKAPNDPDVLVQMGDATMDGDHWVVDGRWQRAIEFYKKALKIKPDLTKAQFGICKAYVEYADLSKSKNKELDIELAKLRTMDAKLADEIVEYRKIYSGGLKGVPAKLPPPAKKP